MAKSIWLKDDDQKGNFTDDGQNTFDEKKRYIGIRLQQGVPLLDRDWNELEDIRRYEEMSLRKWYVGDGSPDDGFKISAAYLPNDFKIAAGRCMVEGFEAVNEPQGKNYILYSEQGIGVLTSPPGNRTDTVYLDVWIKEITEADDPDLSNSKDVKVETCVRHKLVWQVKVNEGSIKLAIPPYHHYYELAKINRKKGTTTISYADIEDLREAIGKKAFNKITTQSLTLKNDQVSSNAWPKLTCDVANQVSLLGNVILYGQLGLNDQLKVNFDDEERNSYWLIINTDEKKNAVKFQGYWQEYHDRESSPFSLALQPEGGNVGIGTTSPQSTLSIGSSNFRLDKSEASPNAGYIRFGDNTGWKFHIGRSGEKSGESNNTGTTGVLMTIKDNGNVGIGTTAPKQKLDIEGNVRIGGSRTYLEGYEDDGSDTHTHWIMSGIFPGVEAPPGTPGLYGTGVEKALGFRAKLGARSGLISKSVVTGPGFIKNFLIDHPLDPENKYLTHSTLEGPEVAVFYRGEAQLSDGEAEVLLPNYFEALTRKENRTVLLTPKFEEDNMISMLAASEVKDGKFTVKAIDRKNLSQKFYWEVKAVRSDVGILEVEEPKKPK